jgi:hypothetical protein
MRMAWLFESPVLTNRGRERADPITTDFGVSGAVEAD